jgi:WD40 repeat protein
MNASTLARSLPASAVRRWRSLRLRTRVALVLLVVALASLSGFLLRERLNDWPPRIVLSDPRLTWPVGFSPDGRTFLTSNEGGITPWDTTTGRKGNPWVYQGTVVGGSYSPDGRIFATAAFHNPGHRTIELIDTTTGRPRTTIPTPYRMVTILGFDEEGRTFRAFQRNSDVAEITTWDATTGQPIATRAISAPSKNGAETISQDGRVLAFLPNMADAIQLWDLEADRSLGFLTGPSGTPTYLSPMAFGADGRTLAVGRVDGAIELWDVPGRKLLRTLPACSDGYQYREIRFAPDSRTFASAVVQRKQSSSIVRLFDDLYLLIFRQANDRKPDYGVVVVDIATGRRIGQVSSAMFPIFSPDGRTLATRERDLSVKLRDLPGPSR